MNKISLQLHKKISVLSIEMPHEAVAFRYLSIMAGILVFAYLYLVCASVLNVIAQRESNQASANLESQIGVLEQKYFTLSQRVTPEEANTLGLLPIAERSYVYRSSSVGVVRDSTNAI